jgi:hypothetical protein
VETHDVCKRVDTGVYAGSAFEVYGTERNRGGHQARKSLFAFLSSTNDQLLSDSPGGTRRLHTCLGASSTVSLPSPGSISSPSSARPGTLLIHSASNRNGKRPDRMSHWSKSHMTRLRLGTSRSMTLYIQLRLQSTGNELDMGKVRRRFVRTLGSEIGHENGDASNCRCIAIDNPRVQPTWIGNTLYHG